MQVESDAPPMGDMPDVREPIPLDEPAEREHREAMQRQRPEDFPPQYHDLAMAHHHAAEDLAQVLPSGDYDQIIPRLNNVLRACVACHLHYRLDHGHRPAD